MEQATPQRSSGEQEAAGFVDRFAHAWANPALERFQALWHPDVVLVQPMLPRLVGMKAATKGFRRLLDGFPGLHGEVLNWNGDADLLFIELRLTTSGGRPLSWTLVDRIQLEGGLLRERITFMDSLPVVVGILTRPSWWPRLIRLQLAR